MNFTYLCLPLLFGGSKKLNEDGGRREEAFEKEVSLVPTYV